VIEFKDYYKILDIDKNSDAEEIIKTYRKLARKYHPDVNPGDEAAATRYSDISEAHHVLTNPEARARYDRLTAAWDAHQKFGTPTDFSWGQWVPTNYQSEDTIDWDAISKENSSDHSDFFFAIFGSIDFDEKDPDAGKAQDYNQQVEVTLEEVLTGTSRILRVGGRRIEVRIPKGAGTGTKIRVRGEGAPSVDGNTKGDLYLDIVVAKHPTLTQEGDDLHMDLPVNLYTAILGGEAVVPTLKGRIKLRIPPETQAGRVFRIKGQGMPGLQNPDHRGDLYAKVIVTLPENLTEEEIELFEELADIRGL